MEGGVGQGSLKEHKSGVEENLEGKNTCALPTSMDPVTESASDSKSVSSAAQESPQQEAITVEGLCVFAFITLIFPNKPAPAGPAQPQGPASTAPL